MGVNMQMVTGRYRVTKARVPMHSINDAVKLGRGHGPCVGVSIPNYPSCHYRRRTEDSESPVVERLHAFADVGSRAPVFLVASTCQLRR
jgi:hypothetical protein